MENNPNKTPESEKAFDPAQQSMSLLDHIRALRHALIVCAIVVVIAVLGIFEFASDRLMSLITEPIRRKGVEIIYTAISEAFLTKFKVSLMAAVVLSSPVLIWQVWAFIRPALYQNERRVLVRLFVSSLALFLLGVSFCYTSVYFLAVDFFMVSGENLATPMLSVDKYVGFLFGFIFPFGVAFMLPVFLYVTTRAGLTTPQGLRAKRKYIILAIFFLAAVLTPPDVVSQVMLGVPMLILYEVGILVSSLALRRAHPGETNAAA